MNTKRIILHIGPPKTGTSALQRFIIRNQKDFEKCGIGYYRPIHTYNPWKNDANGAFIMREALRQLGRNDGLNEYWSVNNLQEDMTLFAEYCKHYQTLILSEEILWNIGANSPDFWVCLRETIRKACGETSAIIDVIMYLRRQDERSVSVWKERMRSPRDGADDFVTTIRRIEESGYHNYREYLKQLLECFDKNHIIVRPYNDVAQENTGIPFDFVKVTSIGDLAGLKVDKNKVYPSFSLNLTEAIRLIKKGDVKCNASFNAIVTAARMISNNETKSLNEYPLPYDARRKLLEQYKEDNCWVAKMFLGREKLFSDEIKEYKVWAPNVERDINNAKSLVKIAEHLEAQSSKMK